MKSPCYQWYTKEALSSTFINDLTLEEEGAYRRLLDYQWEDGFISNDLEKLRKLFKRCSKRKAGNIWSRLSGQFSEVFPGKFQNIRLEFERKKQMRFLELQAEKGRKRWKEKETDGAVALPENSRGFTRAHAPPANANANSEISSSGSDRVDEQPPQLPMRFLFELWGEIGIPMPPALDLVTVQSLLTRFAEIKHRDPCALAREAVGLFSRYMDSHSFRAPKSPLKFTQHWEAIQEMLSGKREPDEFKKARAIERASRPVPIQSPTGQLQAQSRSAEDVLRETYGDAYFEANDE